MFPVFRDMLVRSLPQATQFGKPLVNSMFTLALLVGMSVLETTHGTTIANLGFEEVLLTQLAGCWLRLKEWHHCEHSYVTEACVIEGYYRIRSFAAPVYAWLNFES